MTLDMNAMIIIVVYAVLSNIFLFSLALSSDSLSCPNSKIEYEYNSTANYTSDTYTKATGTDILSLLLGRCEGFPYWVIWLAEIPTVLGILYLIRAFVGFT